ncbi:MAG: hypothetical protein HQL51_01080 [Magnetococcales bacterium]|nr:hypothetical protein [Magnetococcales bacterium]
MEPSLQDGLPASVRSQLDDIARAVGPAYLVGGVLRECLRREPVSNDLNLLLCRPLPDCYQRLESAGFQELSLDRKSNSLLLSLKRQENPKTIAIASCRGHQSGVLCGPEAIVEDLRHRDLTVNAMAWLWPDGPLLDPFNGMEDLDNNTIRLVEGRTTLEGDPLRALRFLRFAIQLPGRPVARDLEACCQTSLSGEDPERLRAEMDRLLSLPLRKCHSQRLIRALFGSPLGESLLPELARLKETFTAYPCAPQAKMNPERQNFYDYTLSMMLEIAAPDKQGEISRLDLRWAGLLHLVGMDRDCKKKGELSPHLLKPGEASLVEIEEILTRLQFSRRRQRRVLSLIQALESQFPQTERGLKRLMEQNAPVESLIRMVKARQSARPDVDDKEHQRINGEFHRAMRRCLALRRSQNSLKIQDLNLSGGDIIELVRRRPGPWLSQVQNQLLTWVVEEPRRNQRDLLSRRVLDWMVEQPDF